MSASVLYLKNALCPHQRSIEQIKLCTIKSRAPQWDLPYIALLNGQAVLRKDWNKRIKHGDILAFVDVNAIPQGGGGGSNPLQAVLMIAVMVYAPQMAFSMFGAAGQTAAAFAASGMGIAATAGIVMAGSMLVNAILPPPKPTSPQQMAALAAASPTYNLQAQGNQARLEAAIPEHFGRHIAYPDFAAQPYVEYAGNEQYLYQLLCIGRGEYDIEAYRIEDTPVASFEDITYEVVGPNTALTLFPANVVSSVEVSGQDMVTDTYIGAFVASAAGTTANYLGIDYVMPRGMYYAADDGSLSTVSITVTAEAMLIDNLGAPLGAWVTLGTETYSAATTTPQRHSERYAVAAGRYQVRVKRTDTKNTSARAGHDVAWAGLRAYLPDTRTFGDVTLIAMRMKASNNLSMQASRKVNVICTRKLPIWNGSTWSANTATRSIAWATAYACKQVGLYDAQIDLATLLALDATWTARGDHFDARFDNFLSFWEGVSKIAGAGRAKPYMQGGVMRVMRDQAATVPVALFSMRNIIKGSFGVDYLMPTADTADAIDVGYFDSGNWAPNRVRAKLADSSAARPAKVELFGVTGRDHAFREGMYQAGCNRYRRKMIKFSTEMEGFIPSFGDLIAVQHDMPAWGQGGEITAWNAGTRTATLSEAPTWGSGTHYIALRKRDGGVDGPYAVTAGATANEVVLASSPAITPYVGGAEERTHYTFGWADTYRQPARVVAVRPRGLHSVEIEAVNEDASVHSADSGVTAPAAQTSQLASYTSVPVIVGLTSRSMPNEPDKMLLDWQPSPWADHYLIEQSSDGVAWTRCGDVTANHFTATAIYGAATIVRVCAVGMAKGPWVQTAYGAAAAAAMAATPPAAPVATATGGMFSVHLAWSFGDYRKDLRGTEIWWSATNDRTAAVRLSFEPYPAQEYNHVALSPGQGGYYWLRVTDTQPTANNSTWYPSSSTAGLHAVASTDPADLLTQLQSSLGLQQLAAELAAPILQVPGATAAAQAAAESVLRLLLKADALKVQAQRDKWILDATSTVDPATGTVTLLATAEISTDIEAALNSVQLQLGAMDGSIISHTASLADHGGRINTAETDIAQMQGEIALTATQSYVDGSIDQALSVVDPAAVAAASQSGAEGLLHALLDSEAGRRQALGAKASLATAQLQLQSHADALVAEAVERLILLAQIGSTQAALVLEQLARVTGDSANASSIATLLARLDTGDFAAVKEESSATVDALGNVEAKWGIQVETMADGVRAAAGLQLLAGTDGETVFAILADKLLIYKPDGSGVPKQIVTLGNINGATALGLDGNLIIDGSVVARSLSVTELSAITAALGTVTTGRMQNTGNTNFINLDATGIQEFIKVGTNISIDAAGNATFNGVVISRNLSVASGTAAGLAGTYGVTAGEGWKKLNTVRIDTGYAAGAWLSANDQTFQALAGLIRGGSSSVGVTYYTSTGAFVANWSVVVSRLYVKSRWNTAATIHLELELWAEVDGDIFQITFTQPSWNLFKVT